MTALADFLVTHRARAAGGGLLLVIASLLVVRAPVIDGTMAGFEVPGNPHRALGESMAELFSPPPVVHIAIEPADTTFGQLLADLRSIESAVLELMPGAEVGSLHSFEPVYAPLGLRDGSPIDSVLAVAARSPIARDLLSRDGDRFLMIVRAPIEPRPAPAVLDRIVAGPYPSVASAHVFSYGHMERDVRSAIARDLTRLVALVLLFAGGFLLASYRSLGALAFVAALTGAASVSALAIQSLLGHPLDVATMLVLPTVLVLSLADAVHLLTGFARPGDHGSVDERLRFTTRHYLVPSLLTSVTTAAAFLSLTTADATSLRRLGAASGAAVMVAFLLAYLLGPYLLGVLPIRPARAPLLGAVVGRVQGIGGRLALPLLAIIPVAIVVLPGLNFSTPPDHFFPAGTPTTAVHDELTADFYSLATLDVLLTPLDESERAPGTPSITKTLSDVSADLEALPGVYAAVSVGNVVAEGRELGIPAPILIAMALDNPFTARDGTAYRIEVRVDDAARIPDLAVEAEALLAGYTDRTGWAVTGLMLALEYVNQRVVSTLLISFAISTLVVLVVIIGLTRTLRGTLVALLANLVPLAAATVTFGVLRLELSVLSAAVLVLSLGLIVDDTLHVLFRLVRDDGTLGELPYGMAVTSLLLSGCFALFLVSSFPPVRILGGAIAGVLLVALVADLTVVPWLFGVGPRGPETRTP